MTDIVTDLLSAASKIEPGWKVVATSNTNNPADAQINFPAGWAVGDTVLAFVTQGYLGTVSTPSGWSLLDSNISGTFLLGGVRADAYLLNKITTQTGFVYNGTNTTDVNVALVVLRGINVPADQMIYPIIDEVGTAATGYSTSPNPPAVTTTTSNNLIIAFAGVSTVTNIPATPAGYTSIQTSQGAGACYNVITQKQELAGVANPGIMSIPSSQYWVAFTYSVRGSLYSKKINFSNFATSTVDVGSVVRTSTTKTFVAETQTPTSFAVSISGGTSSQYQINGGAWTTASGTIQNGDTINVRQTSVAGTKGTTTTTTATVTIDGTAYTYGLRTRRVISSTLNSTVNWTLEYSLTGVTMTAVGGGGHGGTANTIFGGGGGGAGAFSTIPTTTLNAGDAMVLYGGRGGQTASQNGSDSYVSKNGTNILYAKAGLGGASAASGGAGGSGGSASLGIGTTKNNGGNGGNGVSGTSTNRISGGGGGAAGWTGNGGNGGAGVNNTTGIAGTSGAGGGGGGGGSGGGGGGVNVLAAGTSGAGGVAAGGGGGGGSGGVNGSSASGTADGGDYGGGGGGDAGTGGDGVAYVAW